MLIVVLPWPPRQLSPNARMHWAALAKAKGRYRLSCYNAARAYGAKRIDVAALTVRVQFAPPDRRRRDADNMLAAIKAGLDGLADAIGVDDAKWTLVLEPMAAPVQFGEVRVWITEGKP